MKLLSSVGGASGPLYGTLFIRASYGSGSQNRINSGRVAGVSGRRDCRRYRTRKSRTRDKTLCDVWVPVLHEAKKNLQAGMSPSLLLNTMVQDAATAVDNTINYAGEKKDVPVISALAVWAIRSRRDLLLADD